MYLRFLITFFLLNKFSEWENINGQFVFVVYDTLTGKLHIINDRFGFRQFYYYFNGSTFIFSSQVKGIRYLLNRTFEFSQKGLGEFLLFGHHLGDTSAFEDVKCLHAASILTYDGKKLESKRYWRPKYEPDQKVNIDNWIELFQKSVERQIKGGGRKGILLSGGFDSRAVAYAAAKTEEPFIAFTFGEEKTRDVQYAKQICSILGIEHCFLGFNPLMWKKTIPKTIWQTEGEATFHHFKSLQFHPKIKSECDILLTGILGDVSMGHVISPHHLFKLPDKNMPIHAFQKSIQHSLEYINQVLNPKSQSEIIQTAYEMIADTLLQVNNELSEDKLDAWNVDNRQRRFIFIGPSSDRYLFNIRSPFLDYDLFDYSLRIPVRLRYKQKFYKKALWSMMPELRLVPCQKTGQPPFPDISKKVPWLIKNKLALLSGQKSMSNKYSKNFINFGELLRDSFTRPELIELLFGLEKRWHMYFNMKELRKILNEHFARTQNHATLINKLITLNYLEELFIENKHEHYGL